jgi:hypothetical protein
MRPEPIKKYDIQYARDDQDNDIKRRFILSFDRPIKDQEMLAKIDNLLGHQVAGIDVFKVLGRYSAELLIAQTFDPEAVIEVLQEELDVILSDIIQPSRKLEIVKGDA